MPTLLVDNYDSYTYNLFQLLWEVDGDEPLVVRNDELAPDDVTPAALARRGVERVVISPGPGRPERSRDFGICGLLLRTAALPVLGVCLGHQGLAAAHGGRVVHAPEVAHGRISTIRHRGTGLFAGLGQDFRAVRYHSLVVAEPLPPELEAMAWSADGVLMALRHRTRPLWGVQFHPESICTEHGRLLLANFRALEGAAADVAPAAARPSRRTSAARAAASATDAAGPTRTATDDPIAGPPAATAQRLPLRLLTRRLAVAPDPEAVFADLYAAAPTAFWLDSSAAEAGLSRCSFMGDASGPLARVVRYRVGEPLQETTRAGTRLLHEDTIFTYLRRELAALAVDAPALPFDLACGFVGYLGYELKALCGGEPVHRSEIPDAQLLLADRLIAFDHEAGDVHLVALEYADEPNGAGAWLDATAARLAEIAAAGRADPAPTSVPPPAADARLVRPPAQHLRDIARVKRWLVDGETVELCLTNALELDPLADPLAVYHALRRRNPAPYAAYLRFGETAILSSSPERFLRIDRERTVESRPIKGTAPRHADPAADAAARATLAASTKDRAENLMIADLLRNDLGRVCDVGTVTVPDLMAPRSYATVHHLVTTVRGHLRPDADAVDAIEAAFPPGSMTGAPKRRTLELIDRLEQRARGPYAGALGFLALNGTADLSVVIRTVVHTPDHATIGAGGAIVIDSDPDAELAELLLKAQAAHAAITDPGSPPPTAATERSHADPPPPSEPAPTAPATPAATRYRVPSNTPS